MLYKPKCVLSHIDNNKHIQLNLPVAECHGRFLYVDNVDQNYALGRFYCIQTYKLKSIAKSAAAKYR